MNSATNDQTRPSPDAGSGSMRSRGEDPPHSGDLSTDMATVSTAGSGLASTAGSVVADSDALGRAAVTLSTHSESLGVVPVDRALLSEDTIGHPGLAQALGDFMDVWEKRLVEFGGHLAGLGTTLGHAGQRYRDTDDAASQHLGHLDPAHRIDGDTDGAGRQ